MSLSHFGAIVAFAFIAAAATAMAISTIGI